MSERIQIGNATGDALRAQRKPRREQPEITAQPLGTDSYGRVPRRPTLDQLDRQPGGR